MEGLRDRGGHSKDPETGNVLDAKILSANKGAETTTIGSDRWWNYLALRTVVT
jgi:hypothetical protein